VAATTGEPWTLVYDLRVRKHLEKIRDRAVIRRLKEAAARLARFPRSGKSLEHYPGVRSERVGTSGGEYRILYQLDEERREVFVILIASRDEVYELLGRRER
jgi:mRNA-degrading endonuclease RelE of RelBE toxin-antitoxin system